MSKHYPKSPRNLRQQRNVALKHLKEVEDENGELRHMITVRMVPKPETCPEGHPGLVHDPDAMLFHCAVCGRYYYGKVGAREVAAA